MVASVIYAASTKPGRDSFFGQNHQINEFARNHKAQLVKQWDELPEIDEQYATLLTNPSIGLFKVTCNLPYNCVTGLVFILLTTSFKYVLTAFFFLAMVTLLSSINIFPTELNIPSLASSPNGTT